MSAQIKIGLIDHFSIPCKDPEFSVSFYNTVFNARIFEGRHGPYVFGNSPEDKALGRSVHIFLQTQAGQRIELLGHDTGGEAPAGTHHAFQVAAEDFDALGSRLTELGVPYLGPATHRGTDAVSIYFNDPDGNVLEFVVFAGYPNIEKVPLSQHMERRSLKYTWDSASCRGTPEQPRSKGK